MQSKDFEFHYQGYRSTPPLWNGNVLAPYPQIELPDGPPDFKPRENPLPQRLGKRVESFVYHQLRSAPGIEWIADGVQIQENNRTVGELDALYYDHGTPVHLEVAYKFYLYDTLNEQADPMARWIGPNRKDNLSLKLRKMVHRQFPLLHHPATKPYLAAAGLSAGLFQQRICCKGQLFTPYDNPTPPVGPLNEDCVAGFHLPFRELGKLDNHQFYIPRKPDWLTTPQATVPWMDFAAARLKIEEEVRRDRSPMVWWSSVAGELGRCFVTAW